MNNLVIKPNYVSLFNCVGPECEDSCCNDWTITFDKKSYKKTVSHPKFASLAKIAFTEVKKNAANWATVKLDEQGGCPFLDERKLCNIHKHAGEAALSDTCKTYPKLDRHVGGNKYRSLSMSCPEVARIVLFHPDAFQFDAQHSGHKAVVKPSPIWLEKSYEYSLELLVGLGLDWEPALLAIGLLIKTSEEVRAGQLPDSALDERFLQLKQFAEAGLLVEQYAKLPYAPIPQSHAFFGVHSTFCQIHSRATRARFSRLNEAVSAICNEDNEFSVAAMNQAWNAIALPALGEHADLFERYILYAIFHHHFPLLGEEAPLKAFRLLVLDCFIMRGYLSAMAHQHKQLSESDIILCFQIYQVVRQHRPVMAQTIEDVMRECEIESVPAVMSLLKTQ